MADKLNIFQRVMLQWDEMHPYNAVHVVRLPQPLQRQRLTCIARETLEGYGLTNLSVNRAENVFKYRGGAADIEIKVISASKDTLSDLHNEIELQLNTPFTGKSTVTPFRFFVVSEKNSFYFGLTYWHLISDAEAIVFLLKDMMKRYMDEKRAGIFRPLNLYPATYCRTIRIKPKSLMGWIFTLPAYVAGIKASFRPRYKNLNDFSNSFVSFSIKETGFRALLAAKKILGITLNDLFLALLLKALSSFTSERLQESRRRMISVASIVNIRKDLIMDTSKTFGLFLGLFTVSNAVVPGTQLEDLARDVSCQTLKVKKYQLYLRALAELGLARAILSSLTPQRQKKFYPKNYPLLGGITNINLNTLWNQEDEKKPEYYLRAVSTGPVSPLVFSITTTGEVLNVGVSYRTSLFSRIDIEKIISEFSETVYTMKDL